MRAVNRALLLAEKGHARDATTEAGSRRRQDGSCEKEKGRPGGWRPCRITTRERDDGGRSRRYAIRSALLSQSSDPCHQVEPRVYGGQFPNWPESARKAAPEHARIRGPPPETLRRGQGSRRPLAKAPAARRCGIRHCRFWGLHPERGELSAGPQRSTCRVWVSAMSGHYNLLNLSR